MFRSLYETLKAINDSVDYTKMKYDKLDKLRKELSKKGIDKLTGEEKEIYQQVDDELTRRDDRKFNAAQKQMYGEWAAGRRRQHGYGWKDPDKLTYNQKRAQGSRD